MFAIEPFSFLSLPFLSFHAPGKIPTIPASAPPFPTRGLIENDSVEGIYASWRAISEILYLGFVRFFFYLSEESRRYICAEYIVRTLDYLEGENIPGNSGAGSRNRPLLE